MSNRLYGRWPDDGDCWVRRVPQPKPSLFMRAVKFTIAAGFLLFYGLLLAAAVSSCDGIIDPQPRW
jgi:hypothetical protein